MGLLDRLSRLIRATLNDLIGQAEDPEKILEQTVIEMQDDLIRLRQAVAQAIATQKRTERQCAQSQTSAEDWYRRAQLALQKGDESLAREALSRRQALQETATALQTQIDQQRVIVEKLKQNMRLLEGKISDAKTKKDMYIARARSAKASQRLNEMLGNVGTQDAMAAFERMEEKVLQLESQAEAVAELNAGDSIEKQFKSLESSSVDAELAALKAQIAAPMLDSPPASPPASLPNSTDAEIEQLRSRLEEA
ncbi:MAG: PspA/IM30 family protein [Pegethrix bostrychoides GSE-TBD4-15B]|jgi:phage shock protein A|uniref:PspA/IM30 family protein n=1 Tax=Pegethrix bostrychoides GSE-TBD4-15B TaxID=2839662 RepID=A0A951PEI4_9CYAN|nr:PspA/IM30 family protein [Pegethrix bostrychoides GSE-TBD4-15B]